MSETNKTSLWGAVALNTTCMIGSGWFFSAQIAAKHAGNWAFISWVFGALLILSVGLCLSEVVNVYPIRGITTRSSTLSHNKIFGLPFAFCNWFGVLVAVSTEAQGSAQYLSAVVNHGHLLWDNNQLTVYGKILGVFILCLYLAINFWGIKLLARINNKLTLFKVFTPVFTAFILLVAYFDKSNFTLGGIGDHYSPKSILAAVIGAGMIYSFNGFQAAASFASEIENPQKNVKKAIIYSVGIVLVLYLLLQLAFMGAVPHSMLEHSWSGLNFASPLINLSMLLGINFLSALLIADSIISPSGAGYALLGSCSRMLYAMAKERQMPAWIAELCPVYNFSKRAMLINFLFAVTIFYNSSGWAQLIVIVSTYHIIGYMAAPISMSALKPNTKLAGGAVFIILSLFMHLIPKPDLFVANISITALTSLFVIINFKQGLKNILLFSAPFLMYLWALYAVHTKILTVVFSLIFFALAVNKHYLKLCHMDKSAEDPLAILEKKEVEAI